MPTARDVQTAVDGSLASLRSVLLDTGQTSYRGTRGRFFQGIATTGRASLPDNTNAGPEPLTMVPGLGRRPTDQAETWSDFGLMVSSLIYGLEIHVYNGPLGHGWVVILRFRHAGVVYARHVNVGPEAHRTVAWGVEPDYSQVP